MQKTIILLSTILILSIFSSIASAECVDNTALTDYITQWKTDSSTFTMPMLMSKISYWKSGTGCGNEGVIFVDGGLAGNCLGNNYSVANRNCLGSDGIAFNTIQEAANNVSAGDTVLVRAGIYSGFIFKKSGTQTNPITFKSYPGEKAILDGGGTAWAGISDSDDNPSWNIFEDFEIRNYTAYGINVTVNGQTTIGADHITISHNIIHDISSGGTSIAMGIQMRGADYFNISYNEIYRCYSVGMQTDYRDTYLNWAENGIISYNLVHENGDYSVGTGPDGIAGPGSKNLVVEYNIVYGNVDDGIDISSGGGGGNYPLNATVRGNIAFLNGINPNTLIAGNGAGNGIKVSTNAGGGHKIYGNIAFNNKRGGFDQAKEGGWPQNFFYHNTAHKNGNNSSPAQNTFDGFIMDAAGRPMSENAVLYNNISAGHIWSDVFNNDGSSINASNYNFWADGKFVSGMDIHSLSGDPKFNNPDLLVSISFEPDWTIEQKLNYIRNQVEQKFGLKPESLAIDAGTIIPDFHCTTSGLHPEENCREWHGNAPDIGAFEYKP